MQNIQMSVKGTTLTITVDLSKDLGPSASGKTRVIASTKGNQPVPNTDTGAIIGVNVYKKA